MIILGTIQRAELQTLTDKQDKTKTSQMLQLVIMDSTKPVQFRTTTAMIMFLGVEKAQAAFSTLDVNELTDMQVTVCAAEVAPYNAMLKLKGQIVKGHQTGDHLLKMLTPQAPAQTPPAKK
jgi:hypothetical protein